MLGAHMPHHMLAGHAPRHRPHMAGQPTVNVPTKNEASCKDAIDPFIHKNTAN